MAPKIFGFSTAGSGVDRSVFVRIDGRFSIGDQVLQPPIA
jgi:hypothetical protein